MAGLFSNKDDREGTVPAGKHDDAGRSVTIKGQHAEAIGDGHYAYTDQQRHETHGVVDKHGRPVS